MLCKERKSMKFRMTRQSFHFHLTSILFTLSEIQKFTFNKIIIIFINKKKMEDLTVAVVIRMKHIVINRSSGARIFSYVKPSDIYAIKRYESVFLYFHNYHMIILTKQFPPAHYCNVFNGIVQS